MSINKSLTVEVTLQEDHDRTDARVVLRLEGSTFEGWGRARRNPADPEIPKIGDELATARALSDLSHRLVEAAAAAIEAYEGHRVSLKG